MPRLQPHRRRALVVPAAAAFGSVAESADKHAVRCVGQVVGATRQTAGWLPSSGLSSGRLGR